MKRFTTLVFAACLVALAGLGACSDSPTSSRMDAPDSPAVRALSDSTAVTTSETCTEGDSRITDTGTETCTDGVWVGGGMGSGN